MKIIVCVSDNNGFAFNNRRQSKDKDLIKYLCEKYKNTKIKIRPYSASLFQDYLISNQLNNEHLDIAKIEIVTNCFEYKFYEDDEDCYLFVEQVPDFIYYKDKIEEIVYCCWNRKYPTDVYCPEAEEINPNLKWFSFEKIVGNSHDEINIVTYKIKDEMEI